MNAPGLSPGSLIESFKRTHRIFAGIDAAQAGIAKLLREVRFLSLRLARAYLLRAK
jgi:hypothetical protein